MDAHGNIEDRRQALLRILAALVAMAGLILRPHPEVRAEGEPRRTLPRRLRNAVLRLLRPAESATRRLVIALAKNLAVTLPPQRAKKPKPLRRRRQFQPLMPPEPAAPRKPVGAVLPLLDPARRFGRQCAPRRNSVPRISFGGERQKIPPLPSPGDLLDATRLTLRLDALARALADLPKQAARFARWRARQAFLRAKGDRGRAGLRRPLRFGPPPGTRKRRLVHEVHDILAFSHLLALEALADTS